MTNIFLRKNGTLSTLKVIYHKWLDAPDSAIVNDTICSSHDGTIGNLRPIAHVFGKLRNGQRIKVNVCHDCATDVFSDCDVLDKIIDEV